MCYEPVDGLMRWRRKRRHSTNCNNSCPTSHFDIFWLRITMGMSALDYDELTIEQGTGSHSSHVVVKKTSTGEFLTIIQNVSLSRVDDNDSSAI